MQPPGLLDELRELEIGLHQAEFRADPARLSAALHDEFWEMGRSGKYWSRAATLAELPHNPPSHAVWAQDFKAEELTPGVVLLTYRSAHLGEAGVLDRCTARASIWVSDGGRWRMRFHQGTSIAPFEKNPT
ncbi:MAG: DUF4440 domain-containing protein [Ramlibacter sp.]